MGREEILKILEETKKEIRQKYKGHIKGIFGSFVRREEKDSSDIDILVEFEEEADLFDFVGLALFLEEKLNRKVDIVPEKSLREELKGIILDEVIHI